MDVSTYDMTEDFTHSIPSAESFTTIGPIKIDSVAITSTDTIANPGDRIKVRLYLKNTGLNATAMNITTPRALTSLDSNATIEAGGVTLPSFGDIAPGAFSDGNKSYNIDFSETSHTDKEYKFVVNIHSAGNHFWSDTFSVFVYPTGIEDIGVTIPTEFALQQNYPNPFNPSTFISWQLAVMLN